MGRSGKILKNELRELSRRKRAWTYPDLQIQEVDNKQFFSKKALGKVESDNPAVKTYTLTAADPADEGKFSIKMEGSSGVIYVEQYVDREVKDEYKVFIKALASDGSEVEAPVEVKIFILDVNDNIPIFDESSLLAKVQEDDKGLEPFHSIIATDADSSYLGFNVVYFSKVPGSEVPAGNRFTVMGNGKIIVSGELDAENCPQVTFQVEARDRGNFSTTLYNKNSAHVTVTIMDANDHAPVFIGDPYDIKVGELTPIGSSIHTIEATDDDKGMNSQVTFEFVSGNTDGRFRIESIPSESGKSLGKVYVDKELDYETQPHTYDFKIKGYNKDATNAADPRFQSTADLRITVEDENEPPVFKNTPYAGSITEGVTVAQTLGRVQAIDEDFGGQSVTYSIENKEKWFSIDSSGTIKSLQAIDREHESVHDGIYVLQIKATDGSQDSFAEYTVTVLDKNDNAPQPDGGGWDVSICSAFEDEDKAGLVLTTISAKDIDGPMNGAPFRYSFLPNSDFRIESQGNTSALVYPAKKNYEVGVTYEEVVKIQDSPVSEAVQTGTATLTIKVCRCEADGSCSEKIVSPGGFNYLILVGVLVAILILIIVILAAMQYQRKKTADIQKKGLLYDEDDVRENLQPYHDEGGGEEDNDIYDMGVLSRVDPSMPIRVEEKPHRAEPQSRPLLPPNSNIEEYIDNAKKQADGDPTAPPFDSLLVFDYEGQGSDAGSLSSINSGTTEGSQDYDYLNDWGPRFNKIADQYAGDDSD